jgi:hypothetical protein
MGLDHFEKAAEFIPRVDVGNECRWVLRHYGRKRSCGHIATAHGISEEGPHAAQLAEPGFGYGLGFAQERIHMLNTDARNAGSRTTGAAKSPENECIRGEWRSKGLLKGNVLFDQALEVHRTPPRSKSAT